MFDVSFTGMVNAERGMAPVQPAVFILHSAFCIPGFSLAAWALGLHLGELAHQAAGGPCRVCAARLANPEELHNVHAALTQLQAADEAMCASHIFLERGHSCPPVGLRVDPHAKADKNVQCR